MPHPFDGNVTHGPLSLLERPSIAAKIAAVSSAWSMVEGDLQLLYGFLMSRWSGQLPDGAFVPTHPVALLTFTTLQTLNTKLDLLRALGEWALAPDEFRELRDTMVPAVRTRAKERNTVVHGVWGTSQELPEHVILVRTFGSHVAYVEQDFDAILERIEELRRQLWRFRSAVVERVARNGWQAVEPGEELAPGDGQE